ncbi:MAG TPA: hypothetical protein VFF06_35620 [Polyangia bacterium]|nr:hypothetical protein [Polyangia bacterium]
MQRIAIAAVLLFPVAARAWDSAELWYDPANGGNAAPGAMNAIAPGSGGVIGTGGGRDYYITCANCHISDQQQQGVIDVQVAFNPVMPTMSGQSLYEAGQLYQVTVQLLHEHEGLSGCAASTNGNLNNMAAAVEDSSAKPAGVLASDSGQSADACPSALPMVASGTTMMYGDCHAVFSISDKTTVNRASWTFNWTAPAAGAGPLVMTWAWSTAIAKWTHSATT